MRRAELKRHSLDRILAAAARRLREEGPGGAAIVPVMRDAGLIHGAADNHAADSHAADSDSAEPRLDDAIALMTICVGGMSLARAVQDKDFSARILRVARETAGKVASPAGNPETEPEPVQTR